MTRREWRLWVGLPALSIPLCLLVLSPLSDAWNEWFLSETGPIELGTAALFLAASVGAVGYLRKHRPRLPRPYRALFGLFAVTAFFVAMEEISYGQHLLGFESPAWFRQHNYQDETNLHNLFGNKPSRRLRAVGSIAIPLVCIVLPLVYRKRTETWRPGHWTYYLLPRMELIALVAIAQLVTVPDKLPDWIIEDVSRSGELKELYWAIAAFSYIRLLDRRQTEAPARESDAAERAADDAVTAEPSPVRRAA